jgi:hypothetical protein
MSTVAQVTVALAQKFAELREDFHRGSLDLPDGLIDRNCVFRLNGVAYEDTLGGSAANALLRLLGRGPGACRFLMQRLPYHLPDATIALSTLEAAAETRFTAAVTLTGTSRDGGRHVVAPATLTLVTNARTSLVEADLRMEEYDLTRVMAADTA